MRARAAVFRRARTLPRGRVGGRGTPSLACGGEGRLCHRVEGHREHRVSHQAQLPGGRALVRGSVCEQRQRNARERSSDELACACRRSCAARACEGVRARAFAGSTRMQGCCISRGCLSSAQGRHASGERRAQAHTWQARAALLTEAQELLLATCMRSRLLGPDADRRESLFCRRWQWRRGKDTRARADIAWPMARTPAPRSCCTQSPPQPPRQGLQRPSEVGRCRSEVRVRRRRQARVGRCLCRRAYAGSPGADGREAGKAGAPGRRSRHAGAESGCAAARRRCAAADPRLRDPEKR